MPRASQKCSPSLLRTACVLRSKLTRMMRPRGSDAFDGALHISQITSRSNSKTAAILLGYEIRYVLTGLAPPSTPSRNCFSAAASQRAGDEGRLWCVAADELALHTAVSARATTPDTNSFFTAPPEPETGQTLCRLCAGTVRASFGKLLALSCAAITSATRPAHSRETELPPPSMSAA